MKKFRGFALGIIAGCLLSIAVPAFASTAKQYLLVEAEYPLMVSGNAYRNDDLPMLNYRGITYVPLKAVGSLLGVPVQWNSGLKRVEISSASGNRLENTAFRNLQATGSNGRYKVTGEARIFEANMSYAVTDGHRYLFEKFHTLKEGAPAWSAFTLDIRIPEDQLPANGTLHVELFEYSAKDGSKINIISVPLEQFKS